MDIGEILDRFQMSLGQKLQPDCLPNAGGSGIKSAIRIKLCTLLAAGNHGVARIVLDDDSDGVGTRFNLVCNIEEEGNVATFMVAHRLFVDIDGGLVVHRAKVEPYAAGKISLAEFKGAFVNGTMDEVFVTYPGQFAFRAERNIDNLG